MKMTDAQVTRAALARVNEAGRQEGADPPIGWAAYALGVGLGMCLVPVAMVVAAPSALLRAWAAWLLCEWYLPDVAPTFAQWVGIMFAIVVVRPPRHEPFTEAMARKAHPGEAARHSVTGFAAALAAPVMLLGIGWALSWALL